MSFPFYHRSSNKASRAKDSAGADHRHTSSILATAPNYIDTTQSGPPTNIRSTASRLFLIPFLGRRRKSTTALRSSEIKPDGIVQGEDIRRGGAAHKTVSQLAEESAARFAQRASLGGVGSFSTGNLELPILEVSPFKCVPNSYPHKGSASSVRHTLGPTHNAYTATLDKATIQKNKHLSDKPKSSFLSRVTSRPSLSARYSSADLKSTSKSRSMFKSPEKVADNNAYTPSPQRHNITHQTPTPDADVSGDHDFFSSPRAAPTPPSATFAPPPCLPLNSPSDSCQKPETPLRKRNSVFTSNPGSNACSPHEISLENRSVAYSVETPRARTNTALKTVSESLVSPSNADQTSVEPKEAENHTGNDKPAARPRPCLVRIGNEKVTLSVANVLETELGIDVTDSDDGSINTDPAGQVSPSLHMQRATNRATSFKSSDVCDSTEPLPLDVSGLVTDAVLAVNFPDVACETVVHEKNSESPLSRLISSPPSKRTAQYTQTPVADTWKQSRQSFYNKSPETIHSKASPFMTPTKSNHRHDLAPLNVRSACQSPVSVAHVTSSDNAHLDQKGELSATTINASSRPMTSPKTPDKNAKNVVMPDVKQLQVSLDIQCARFDRLARHLLSIIQRHENEKVHYEKQISQLEKEARRRDREIKGLRWLVERSTRVASQEDYASRVSVRVSSMQSFLSIAASDAEVDLSAAMDMLARAHHRDSSPESIKETDGLPSTEHSPTSTLIRSKKQDLRRARTMPDLHADGHVTRDIPNHLPPTPSPPKNGLGGLGLGLEFPLPEPLSLPSIAGTIIASSANSTTSIPALTNAPTIDSSLSLASRAGQPVNGSCVSGDLGKAKSPESPSRTYLPKVDSASQVAMAATAAKNARERRKAGEWHAGARVYTPGYRVGPDEKPVTLDLACESVPVTPTGTPASVAYARNLNKCLSPSINRVAKEVHKQSEAELRAIYQTVISHSVVSSV